MTEKLLPCPVHVAKSPVDEGYDGLIIVSHAAEILSKVTELKAIYEHVHRYMQLDASVKGASKPATIPVPTNILPSGRVIYCSTGPLNRDYDDIRRYGEAAEEAMKKALAAGCKRPLLIAVPHADYANAQLVALLGALFALYTPLQLREAHPERQNKATALGVWCQNTDAITKTVNIAKAIESGRYLARDVQGSDPERMAPPRVADYVKAAFVDGASGGVRVNVTDDPAVIAKEFPTMAAVNRAATTIPRHQARLIWLEYQGEGPVEHTLMLVGKGVTLDTGGTDVKTGGAMYGMSGDKGGAAAVGGFFKVLDVLRPAGIRVVGYMAMVRNSIGEEAYTCDEILTARSGKRLQVVNTDAEGRLTMLDPLCHMRQLAAKEKNPHLFTVATLTGHAVLTVGEGYSIAMDNGPALQQKTCYQLQDAGETIGEPVEVSRLRREDYTFHEGPGGIAELRQGNNKPSVQTCRGHMTPAAFMIVGSGLSEHGVDSAHPLPYTHIDCAGGVGSFHFETAPTGGPLTALTARYVLPRV